MESFRRFYHELRIRRTGSTTEKHVLYTIDDVQGERRYSTLVPVTISVRTENRSTPEANLLNWRTGVELDDRSEIIQSCATLVRSIRTQPGNDQSSIDRMVAVAPDQLSRFVKGGDFDSGAFLRTTVRQAGELRSDRQTVRIVGSIWTEGNRSRFASALQYARERSSTKPQMLIWARPSVPYWGMTMRLPEMLAAVSKAFSPPEAHSQIRAIVINEREAPKSLQKTFNAIVPVFPKIGHGALELFLVPHHLAFVSVRLSGTDGGYPTPLGILSFDTEVVRRVHTLVSQLLDDARDASYVDWESSGVLTEIDSALDPPSA